MNSLNSPRLGKLWIRRSVLLLTVICMVTGLVVAVTGFFRLSRDARCLRNSLTQSALVQSVVWNKKLELRLGSISCYLLRTGLSFAPLEPEARAALQAIRGAEVGIYKVTSSGGDLDRAAMLLAADRAMCKRGWERLLGVTKEHEMVAVYVPMGQWKGARMDACVAVLTRRELVVVSARSNLEPLIELALNQPEWRNQSWMPVRL